MIVYVESNFILELVLLQDQYKSCENILELCQKGKIDLVLPAFCVAETFHTQVSKTRVREELSRKVTDEIRQLSRSKPYEEVISELGNIASFFLKVSEEQIARFHQTLDRTLKTAEIIPLDSKILSFADKLQSAHKFSTPQDSVVLASVLSHLSKIAVGKKCFLERDEKDFKDPDIVDILEKYDCKIFYRFDSGYQYIQSQIA